LTEPVAVDDPTDPRLFDFVELRDGRSPDGAFIVEGLTPLSELVRSQYRVRAVLVAHSKVAAVAPLLEGTDAPLYAVFKAGKSRTYLAYNPHPESATVHFSDGAELKVKANAYGYLKKAISSEE